MAGCRWVEVAPGRQRLVFEDKEEPESRRAFNVGLSGKRLSEAERQAVFVQQGKHAETWGDLKKILGKEHRIVERGDHVDRTLRGIHERNSG